jgi:hypothetical protein
MKTHTLNIKTPSKKLLSFVRKLQSNKERSKKELIEKKEGYFQKS